MEFSQLYRKAFLFYAELLEYVIRAKFGLWADGLWRESIPSSTAECHC